MDQYIICKMGIKGHRFLTGFISVLAQTSNITVMDRLSNFIKSQDDFHTMSKETGNSCLFAKDNIVTGKEQVEETKQVERTTQDLENIMHKYIIATMGIKGYRFFTDLISVVGKTSNITMMDRLSNFIRSQDDFHTMSKEIGNWCPSPKENIVTRDKQAASNNNHSQELIRIMKADIQGVFEFAKKTIKIAREYPPRKNENKMVYGKVLELLLINQIDKCYTKCFSLDERHHVGSAYKNDCVLTINDEAVPYSIKMSKSGGEIILLNVKTEKYDHSKDILGANFMIFHINQRRLYIFSHDGETAQYLHANTQACIKYKASIFKHLYQTGKYVDLPPQLIQEVDKYEDECERNLQPIDMFKLIAEKNY